MSGLRRILRTAARVLTTTTHTPILPASVGAAGLSLSRVKTPITFYRVTCSNLQENTAIRNLLKNKPEATCFNGMLSTDLIVKGIDQQVLLELVGASRVSKVSPAV